MATLLEYKCPCCGGSINFDSSAQKMVCPYCDTEFEMETLKAYDEQLKSEGSENMDWENTAGSQWREDEKDNVTVYSCQSCGGEIICDANTAAASCPYCGNPVVMTSRLSGELRPDMIIPFKLDKKAAKEKLKLHFKGKRLLPKVFKDENHIDEIKGIYVPFWLFDCDADANVRYRATRVRCWSDSRYNYTDTSYFLVNREGTLGFDKIPVDASTKVPDDLMDSIEPFNYSDAVDFQTAYLAGYLADKYDVSAEDSMERANRRVRNSTEAAFAGTVHGYSTVMPEHADIRINKSSLKYALMPVWILNTTWKEQKYIFAMNGQTGKFVGNLPVDRGAFWRWFMGLFVGIGAVASAVIILCMMLL